MAKLQTAKSSPMGEEALIEAIRRQELPAFEELYRLYHPRLTRFLYKLVRRPQMIEEIVNDTLMVVWARADSFNGASKLSTWIFGIAYRTAMKARRKFDEPVEDRSRPELVADDTPPDLELGHARRQTLLLEAMSHLSPEHRAVVDLTYFHEMGYREIAAIVDCPVDTVKTRMFHARRRLRRFLEGELPDWL